MFIMLEMANAFDRVRHSFVFVILNKFRFDNRFISWIENYIEGPLLLPLNWFFRHCQTIELNQYRSILTTNLARAKRDQIS